MKRVQKHGDTRTACDERLDAREPHYWGKRVIEGLILAETLVLCVNVLF